jgi:SRSO17 transposase
LCPECLVVIDAWIIEENGKMSCSRYWIERPLEDAKGEGGLADYELRDYIGWNHHMGMFFMAMLSSVNKFYINEVR